MVSDVGRGFNAKTIKPTMNSICSFHFVRRHAEKKKLGKI